MTDYTLTVEADQTTEISFTAEVAFKVGKLREKFLSAESLMVYLEGDFGFKTECYFDAHHHGFHSAVRWCRDAWAAWESHKERLMKMDRTDLHGLALTEIAERHLQDRAPYHVSKFIVGFDPALPGSDRSVHWVINKTAHTSGHKYTQDEIRFE